MSSYPRFLPSRSSVAQRTPRPQLVPPPRPRYTALALWHLLSLDAPTVAALWTVFIARCSHLHLPWTEPAAMFIAVWMIYAADRLLDARLLDTNILNTHPLDTPSIEPSIASADLEARHRFHHRYRSAFSTFIVLSSVALAALLHRIDPRSLHLYVLLATLLAGWMLLIHSQPNLVHNSATATVRRLPKEIAVGIFFPAAVFIPTLARTAALPAAIHFLGAAANWIRPTLLPSALLFAAVCMLNCLCLYAWEHPTSRVETAAPRPQPHWTTRWATSRLTYLALLLLAASTIASVSRALPIALPALACSLSTALLFGLNLYRRRLSAIHLRAMADLVLLTPILFLPFVR
jgi:hypothetical protein